MLSGMGKVLREAPGEIWCPVLSMTAPVLEGRGGEPYLGDVAGLLSPHLPQHRAQVRDHVCNQVCVCERVGTGCSWDPEITVGKY